MSLSVNPHSNKCKMVTNVGVSIPRNVYSTNFHCYNIWHGTHQRDLTKALDEECLSSTEHEKLISLFLSVQTSLSFALFPLEPLRWKSDCSRLKDRSASSSALVFSHEKTTDIHTSATQRANVSEGVMLIIIHVEILIFVSTYIQQLQPNMSNPTMCLQQQH